MIFIKKLKTNIIKKNNRNPYLSCGILPLISGQAGSGMTASGLVILLMLVFLAVPDIFPQRMLDDFESADQWKVYKSDGVETNVSIVPGHTGKAIRFDYNFTKGTGYGGIQKMIPLDLPENYQFTFYLKAESPSNNLEFKLLDSTGQNVWWMINRDYTFPAEWTKIKIKKKHISFAWGPKENKTLKRIDRLEFTISSFVGGKGSIYIDDLKFEELPPEDNSPITLTAKASSEAGLNFTVQNLIDNNISTEWKSSGDEKQDVILDLQRRREFGAVVLYWDSADYAKQFEIYSSGKDDKWKKLYSVNRETANTSYIRLKEEDAEKIKITLLKSSRGRGYGINEISVKNSDYSDGLNRFFINIAKDYPAGYYPRYLGEKGAFWTIVGVNNDRKEALFNEDGMAEVDKKDFSIEPFLSIDGKFLTWNDVEEKQSLYNNYLPIPAVEWNYNNLKLTTEAFASGEANKSSSLFLKYIINNNSSQQHKGNLYLAISPFQVNPYYQWLNITGGAAEIDSINYRDGKVYVNDHKVILPVTPADNFGAASFDEGPITWYLSKGKIPPNQSIVDKNKSASGVLDYSYDLAPGECRNVYLVVPFYGEESLKESLTADDIETTLKNDVAFWEKKVDHIKFNLPPSGSRIVNTWKSNLAYILINKDSAGIQPGSRSYERSWIRDGALTSSALLKSGIVKEVRNFIRWYASYQYENGKVPCVVDTRGPDPVPENDSHGEFIYLIKEYFNFTKDTLFLKEMNPHILTAVDYMDTLISQRMTPHFKNGNDSVRAYYGIMPESISHEGYSAKPMHSYWDDFFTMKGLKDAAETERILGEEASYRKIKKMRDTFRKNLYNSLDLAIKENKINYIPGCVELGDFDPTSTTIAISPCNELPDLPEPYARNTFDKYFEFFKNRKDNKIEWTAYTPYENRLIGSFIFLDEPERAHELIKFFLNDQKPQNWNEWAEVVWHKERYPGYIGDMPHTWVGSDFINSVRSMFVYEREYDSSLVLGAALYRDWVDSPEGMSVENLPTYFGELSYSINRSGNNYKVKLFGNVSLPPGGIILKNVFRNKAPENVRVNEKTITSFDENFIRINTFPAEIEISFGEN